MELVELAKMLIDANIPFTIEDCLGTAQICIPDKSKSIGDVICHRYSYGGIDGLLEIAGFDIDTDEIGDTVLGYLTAAQAFKHIKNSIGGCYE